MRDHDRDIMVPSTPSGGGVLTPSGDPLREGVPYGVGPDPTPWGVPLGYPPPVGVTLGSTLILGILGRPYLLDRVDRASTSGQALRHEPVHPYCCPFCDCAPTPPYGPIWIP